tara:strand:+ start:838 stop:1215 length:378 start_codon:yes stop_codon:yes gene_type:complete
MNKKIIDLIKTRLENGAKKYGEELDPADGREWIQESIEEILDTCVYLSAKLLQIKKAEEEGSFRGPPYSMAQPHVKPVKISEEEVMLLHECLDDLSTNTYIDSGISEKYAKLKKLAAKIKKAGKI